MGTERKVAVITGASQGIGAALVRAYRDRGYVVIATSRSITPSNDDGIVVVSGDIADRRTAERAISEGVARFGRIDTLVNNAGIFIAKRLPSTAKRTMRRYSGSTPPASSTRRNSRFPRWRSGAGTYRSDNVKPRAFHVFIEAYPALAK